MHIHLDPVGGVAGDMFMAALLDAFPQHLGAVVAAIRDAGFGPEVEIDLVDMHDGILAGRRFVVTKTCQSTPYKSTTHTHQAWSDLRRSLQDGALSDPIRTHAIGIFNELAQAEAQVHGKDIDAVTFHEVGNWDSVADIVGAAALIDALSPATWSVGALPIGRGRVTTAHGELAVPAPATTLLLEGFALYDDGRPGERVTPTGAAILRYLSPASGIGSAPRTLNTSGFGFGTRQLPGISNTLRALAFDIGPHPATQDRVGVIQFEIDDQTGEEIAVALAHLRDHADVIDATQAMVTGKKGRMMTAIQVLTRPDAIDDVAMACFRQTTTIGLRTRVEGRHVLPRRTQETGDGVPVKIVDRPGGPTAKAEIDAVRADASGQKVRASTRRAAERDALGD